MNPNAEVPYSDFYFTSYGLVKFRFLSYTLSISSFLKYVTVVVTQEFHLCQVILDKSTISVIPIIQRYYDNSVIPIIHLLLMPNDGKFAGN